MSAPQRPGGPTYDIDRLREAVGWCGAARENVVDRRHLRAYLTAIGEPDVERDTAPPTFVACYLDEPPPVEAAERYGAAWLNGGDRFDCVDVLRVGDTVRSQTRLTGVVEKHGRSGPLALLTFVTEFRGAQGSLLLTHTGTRIRR